ncbi:hypothetical protein DICPUDRAFT_74768 [Dictyostelium purpureum]|uniref:Poly A polymerase head domain-containing protein n=1 Tax=Dictyostelium purpureum TaxID=5786 RepID=F0Z8P5_DICPU|nr:uncharacterized protein DICPUDRAFT_74768 [Dictyostelium purpureum]EGC39669.1 hypothetical protein DICPUDRAFT_74768 [Dictyostelium purpureum]|eukprot:XP_003283778.1 hypothetical protein DICPUDRAFT_74768 [Dictyostelium purpureum]
MNQLLNNLKKIKINNLFKKTKKNIDFEKDLNENEKHIIGYLKQVLQYHNRNDIELRVAGGWVRDKLLNYKNNKLDLDFAINNTTGVEFVEMIQKYRTEKELKTVYSEYTIKMNPEKSKHLETVSITIDDFTIEFNALRSDFYDENSRIPQIQVGTLLSDSLRRDLTINALFYNINTLMVEDHSGYGLADLENGIIRTPLEPFNTLTEDPLRAFRILRFATKFNFKIEPLLYQHIKTINNNIIKKVSKERIYTEFFLMMSVREYSEQYFSYLLDTGIINSIFIVNDYIPSSATLEQSVEIWKDSLEFIKTSNNLFPNTKEIENLDFYITLIFYPLYKNCKLKKTEIISVLKEFKSPSKLIKQMERSFEVSELFSILILKYINQLKDSSNSNRDQKSLKEFLKEEEQENEIYELIFSIKKYPDWRLSLYLSLVDLKYRINNNKIIIDGLAVSNNSNNNIKLINLLEESLEINSNINDETNIAIKKLINNSNVNGWLNSVLDSFNELFESHCIPLSQVPFLMDGRELMDLFPSIKEKQAKDSRFLNQLIKTTYFYQLKNNIKTKQELINYLNKDFL